MLFAALVNPALIPIPYRIYQPKRAGNLPIPANPPVNKWDATLVEMVLTLNMKRVLVTVMSPLSLTNTVDMLHLSYTATMMRLMSMLMVDQSIKKD